MNYIIILIVLFVIELIYFKIADKYNIIDKPNERSSHTTITLRGGGVIFYFGALIFFIFSGFQYPYFFLGLTAITVISFLDDIFTLSNRIRLSIHLTSVLLMFYQVGLFELSLWLIPIALILCIGIINAYNFMDGINGITVSNSLAILILLAISNLQINFVDANIIYYTILSCLVFGFYNFRNKAKCFAGDVGSVCIAFIVVFLIALLIIKTQNINYILFLTVYGLDTVLTIVRRLSKKENIFEAHRSHLYQYYANENKSNRLLISSIYGLLQLLIGIIVIYCTRFNLTIQIISSISIIVIFGLIYLYLKYNLIKKHNL
ncbi:MraY family glycosyltransferase [Flavobacterium sp. I3-2]|uniref:MraY family glycosyltransferase n=1 Tax=Flavobacterium sp. I3-2 TaxID=2748319 RepID=UPI0015A85122|nr:glycosyltransferase family 4 protein [Flavobacterium sp. I3-2]